MSRQRPLIFPAKDGIFQRLSLVVFKEIPDIGVILKLAKTKIDKQFEYNTYIRDFFEDNKDKNLDAAIACWKYKKSLPGHNRYEKEDLIALKKL